MTTSHQELQKWVEEVATLTKPEKIHWCTGSEEEYEHLTKEMVASGDLLPLNSESHPNCFLHRSDPNDVARTEHLTFVCTSKKEEAGPNNNWISPEEGHERADKVFAGAMTGRTMYVVPYCMGPIESPYSRLGVEITDSAYVAANMKHMTRMGTEALKKIEEKKSFVKGLHSTGDLSLEKRMILHFPEELSIKSFGSGYGGNALLGKKCHALRIASYQAQREGWLAEHMLILGLESPEGETQYVAAAFPSACGKTNLAMLIPPESYKGWKVWTVGDDIAWMHLGEDGRLYAINPEAGFFGVAPGTSEKTNPNALKMLQKDTIFTNVALTEDKKPWWEGLDNETPTHDWQGRPYSSENGKAAHPNSRFTVSSKKCPSYSKEAEAAQGVPISAIIFGGRRPSLIPLVYEAKNWTHGVMMGAAMSSETTAAATGKVGVLRNDPMAMKPFCGYHFGNYWQHWVSFNKRSNNLPKVFHVNWFRQNDKGEFMWPGFGENIRVLEWILKRAKGQGEAVRSPIGYIPKNGAVNTQGLELEPQAMEELCDVKPQGWQEELDHIESFWKNFEPQIPGELKQELSNIRQELHS